MNGQKMSETSQYLEHEWHWLQNEWLLLIDVVVRGLLFCLCCWLLLFLSGMIGGFFALLASVLVMILAYMAWQFVKREVWQLILT